MAKSKATRADYRLRIKDGFHGTLTYLTRHNGGVSYFSASETPLALSNLLQGEAAETRFKMQDARDGTNAARELIAVLRNMWRGNPTHCPRVEII